MPQSQLQLPEGFEEISITPSFLDEEAKKFGLSKSSGFRTPQRNKKVGGVETSYHLKGQAGDYIGTLEQRRNFYNYLKTNYKYDLKELLYEDDHIHVATDAVPEGFIEESKASKILQKPKQTDSFFREQFKESFRQKHPSAFAPVTQEAISPEKIEKVKKYLKREPETSEELFARQKAIAKKLGIENVQVPGAAEKAEALKPPYQRIAEGLLSLPMAAAEIGGYAALAGLSSQGAPGTLGYNPYAAKAAEKLSELIGQPELAEFEKARELFKQKGYKHPHQALADPEIAVQLLKSAPFFGPQAAHGIKQFESGDVAGGLITTGMLFAPLLGKAGKGGRFKAVEESLASRIAEYEDRTGITPETQIQGAKIAKAVEPEAFVPVVETPTTITPITPITETPVTEAPTSIKSVIDESLAIQQSMTKAQIIAELKTKSGVFNATKGTKADLALKLAKARQPKTPAAELPGLKEAPELKEIPEGFVEAPTTAKVMTPEGSGTSVISAEELARNEIFYTITPDGRLKSYQGKQPDNLSLKPSEAIIGINKSTGEIRVAGGSPEAFIKNEAKVRQALTTEKILSKPSIIKEPTKKPVKKLGKKELKKQYQADLEHNLDRMFAGAKRVEEGKYGYTEPQSELDGLSLASLEDEINQRTLEHIKQGVFTKAELDDIEFAQHAKAYPESLDALAAMAEKKEPIEPIEPKGLTRVTTSIKKLPSPDGGYEVTINNKKYRIFRDPGDTNWYLDSEGRLPYEPHTNWGTNRLLSTTTKADAIKELENKIAKGHYKGAEIPKEAPIKPTIMAKPVATETGIPEGFSVEESPVTAGKWRVRTPEGITKNYATKELAEARLQEEIAHHENIAQFKENQKTKRGSGGLDTEDMGRLTQMALHHIKQGVESFADFVEKMADVTKDKVILKQIYDQVNESQLKEFQAGLNPLAAAKYFEDLNIPPGSPRIPPGGTGSFRTIYPGEKGHVNPFGSPLSRAGQPGQYEIREPVYGKAESDLIRNAEYNVAELETRWGKLLDDINDNLNKAYQVVTGKTLFPRGLKRLSGKAQRDAFTKDFVDLIELDFDDPARQAISTSTTPLGDALRTHDALTEEWRQYIIHTQRELGRTIPDDWGVTTKGYFRHLFLGDIQVRVDGKFIGTAPTYAEAQRMALDIWKTNPNANVEAVARNMFEGDPTLRLSNRKYWGFLGRVKKTLDQNNPLITITADDIRADLIGVVGREAARQKSFGALFKREGYKGYSDDYVKVMKIHSAQLANSQEISKLHHSSQPIIEHLKSNGLSGLAEDITEHINHIWGVPTKNELRVGDWIRRGKNPVSRILRNYVANPDFALRSLAWKIGRINNFLHLDWNIRSASVNRFQPLTTLWPYVTSRQYAGYEKAMLSPSTWERLSNLDVLRGKPKVEVGASMGKNPFTLASEWNRGVGYLHGEFDAARLGITDPREVHRWAMDWAERVEFNNSKWNVAPVLRSPIAKIIGQYKGYLLKDIENIQQTFRTTPIEPIPKKLRIAKQLGARFATGGLNTALKAMPWIAGYEILTALNDQFKSMGMNERTAEELSEAIMMGSPSLIGLDLSGSFSLIDFYGNSTLETLANFGFGPTVQKGIRMAEAKTPEKFFRALTPYAKATNILDAITGKQTSTDLDANYKLEISRYEAIMEALGYTLERKSLYFLMKEAKINPRSGEKRLQRPRREKRLLKDVGPE